MRRRLRVRAWGLYRDGRLVAAMRASSRLEALMMFSAYGHDGDEVRRII